jgi:hypothetical protein
MPAPTVTGLVVNVERLGCTAWGNPMHRVTLSTPTEGFDGVSVFRISNDASLNYGINNSEYRDVPHVFVLTRAGRISHDLGPVE